jgi:DNA polymerase-4
VQAEAGEAKSIGQEHTFDEDEAEPTRLRRALLSLADGVAARLRHHKLRGRTITLKYRDEDFRTLTRAETLGSATDHGDVLFAVAARLFGSVHGKKRVRLLGIYVSGFAGANQLDLFAPPAAPGDALRDSLTARFGEKALTRASLLRPRKQPHP